jgi:hypothetical protein
MCLLLLLLGAILLLSDFIKHDRVGGGTFSFLIFSINNRLHCFNQVMLDVLWIYHNDINVIDCFENDLKLSIHKIHFGENFPLLLNPFFHDLDYEGFVKSIEFYQPTFFFVVVVVLLENPVLGTHSRNLTLTYSLVVFYLLFLTKFST